MAFVTTKDGVNIFFKDWGPKEAQPIVFHHGWPLSADDWDNQMLFFLAEGFRVIANDRRGHGRYDHVSEGHDICITPCISAILPAAGRLRATLRSMVSRRGVWPKRC